MSKCVFCTGVGVATTNTTTPGEAFPFLCVQLGINPTQGQMAISAAALCSTCHSLWEEVTLLYTNMQGLVNLMGRRVGQLRQQLSNDKLPKGDKSGKRQKMSTPKELPSSESLLNWWYPSMTSTTPVATTTTITTTVELGNVKSEPFDGVEMIDDLDSDGGDNDMDGMEDIEILPEDDNNSDENEDDSDPTYDPLASSSSHSSSRTQNKSGSSNSRKGGNNSGCGTSGTTSPPSVTMVPSPFEVLPSWTSRGRPQLAKLGHMFQLSKRCREKLSWICAQSRNTKCHVLLHTSKDLDNPTLLMESGTHNHPPNHDACERRIVLTKIMLDAASCDDTAEEILARHVAQNAANPEAAVKLPLLQNIKRGIRIMRAANGRGPPLPPKIQKEKREVIYFLPPPTQ